MWNWTCWLYRGVLFLHAFVFSDIFVCIFWVRGLWASYVASLWFCWPCQSLGLWHPRWEWAFAVFPCFDRAPACLWGDLSNSKIPRFFGSGASHQKSLYWQLVHAPLLDSNLILIAQPSHCTHLIGLLFYIGFVLLGSSSPHVIVLAICALNKKPLREEEEEDLCNRNPQEHLRRVVTGVGIWIRYYKSETK